MRRPLLVLAVALLVAQAAPREEQASVDARGPADARAFIAAATSTPVATSPRTPLGLAAAVRAVRAVRREGPIAARRAFALAEAALAAADGADDVGARADLLEESSELLAELKWPAAALAARQQALSLRLKAGGGSATVSELVLAYTAMAQVLQQDARPRQALEMLGRAHKAVGHGEGTSASASRGAAAASAASRAVLLKLSSTAHECSGDAAAALADFELALRLTNPPRPGEARGGRLPRADAVPSDELLVHLALLRRAIAATKADEATDAAAAARGAEAGRSRSRLEKLHKRERGTVAALLARGPWTHAQQLPKDFTRSLASRPWHSVAQHFHLLAPVEAALAAAASGLAADLTLLRERRLLLPELECINDAARGSWTWFATNGFWLEGFDERSDFCSERVTPAACALLSRLAAEQPWLRVLRGSFSVLGGGAHLHPHCGTTNAQLKMHVGLEVPLKRDGEGCARIRVGNETRRWSQGRVLFFDDSFEHEVWNDCDDRERSVFQLVFEHPDLRRGSEAGGALTAGH